MSWKWAILPAPFVIIGIVMLVNQPRYHREKAACEAQGRFYWRGHCLPQECSVVYP